MKREIFQTNESLGHLEVNDDEPETSPSGGPLAPTGFKIEGEDDYDPLYRKILPDYNPNAGSGGPMMPGVSLDDGENN